MLNILNINKEHGNKVVLSDVSFYLGTKQKVALVGSNGVGKSTLMKILSGIETVDSGNISIDSGTSIGYLPQDMVVVGNMTIWQYLESVVGIGDIKRKMEELVSDLGSTKKSDQYETLSREFEHLGGYSFEHKAQILLSGFGLGKIDKDRLIDSLSSGQKSKVGLTAILLKGVDLLLLDEPTNNLDLPALIWLEEYIKSSDASCIIVSHDRRFLDNVVDKVIKIDSRSHGIVEHNGSYSDFMEFKERQLQEQKRLYTEQQAKIGDLERAIVQKKVWSKEGAAKAAKNTDEKEKRIRNRRIENAEQLSRKVRPLATRVERIKKEGVESPWEDEPLDISFEFEKGIGKPEIQLDGVVAGYPVGFRVGPVNLSIPFGSRLALVGENGSGKSTLFKTMIGTLKPLSGSVYRSPAIIIGNLMQEHENLPRDSTPFDFLNKNCGVSKQESYRLLKVFGFSDNEFAKKNSILSPGERARLLLASFSAQKVNVLALDEPTNHLDLEALGALEEVLKSYKGTVIIVSHDRAFLENAKLTDICLVSRNGIQHLSDISSYVSRITEESRRMIRLIS